MKISLNEIIKLVPSASKVETDELIKLVGSRLVEVEEKIDLSKKYKGAYIVRIAECEPIPDTHLHLCQIEVTGDIAGGTPDDFAVGKTARESAMAGPVTSTVQVVCGAPNVRAGMYAIWLSPGAIVPQTFGEENFKLDVRKLRGYDSHGMLAGLDELDLGDDHSGIVEIDPHQKFVDNTGTEREIVPGDSFAEVFELNDIVLDIENKSLTHRPDTFGLIGFAREVAGILGVKFDEEGAIIASVRSGATGGTPDGFAVGKTAEESVATGPRTNESAPVVTITSTDLCPRYSCAIVKMSDALTDDKYLTPMDVFLAKAGMRGISKIVDVTNYLMLMTGQPLHAFDYDKFIKVGNSKTPKIIVRSAKEGEELQLLDGKTIKCNTNDILITSNDVPVALAGAMGGASTEIDKSTTRVIIESATFSLYNMRKTQMAHGIFSEAITRFTKGQPESNTMPVLQEAVAMLGGELEGYTDAYPSPTKPSVVKITTLDINNLLGTNYDTDLIIKTLENVGFEVKSTNNSAREATGDTAWGTPGESARSDAKLGEDAVAGPVASAEESVATGPRTLSVKSPSWRTDIHIKEDIIEEVGRLLGYDNIPLSFPLRPYKSGVKNEMLSLKSAIRNTLSRDLSANELLTYSFVSRNLQQTVGEDPEDSYEIINSISPELQRFRQSLIPSLLEKARDNLKSGHSDFSLYEINQVTKKSYGLDEDKVPVLHTHLTYVTTGDYYQAKAELTELLKSLGFKHLDFEKYAGDFPYLEPLHSATIKTTSQSELANTNKSTGKSAGKNETSNSETPLAHLGEIKSGVLKHLKIEGTISAFELSLDHLLEVLPNSSTKMPALSKFPSVERDLTLKVKSDVEFAKVQSAIKNALAQAGTPQGSTSQSDLTADSLAQNSLIYTLTPTSIYQSEKDSTTKNLSFHLEFASPKKTLENAEISAIMEEITECAKKEVGAEIV